MDAANRMLINRHQLQQHQQQHHQQPQYVDMSSPYFLIIQTFHSLPHLNMWFELSNSTFDPNSSDYLETILFWSTVPILLLIFILLLLIIYACCLVVIANSRSVIKLDSSSSSSSSRYKKHTRLCTYRFTISLFILILGVSMGFVVYGSEKFHESFSHMTAHFRNFSNYFGSVGNQTMLARHSIDKQMNTTLAQFERDLRRRLDENSSNMGAQSSQSKLTSEAIRELLNIKSSLNDSLNALEPLSQLEHERAAHLDTLNQFNAAEHTRWAIMVGVVTTNAFLMALLILGLIKNSKGSLCFFAFAGVLSLISFWVLTALYLGITVFIADFCTSPDQYILTVAEKNQIKNMVQYFTTCTVNQKVESGSMRHATKYTPFKQDINRVYSKLRTALTQYNDNLERMSKPVLGDERIQAYRFPEAILAIESVVDKIVSMLKCEQTSENYRAAVNDLCTTSIQGLAIIVGGTILFGLMMPILICVIPQMWRRLHKKEAYEYHRHNFGGASGGPISSSAPAYSANSHMEESHPFLSLNNVPSIPRSAATAANNVVSAAVRQFNESPNFQRLTVAQSSTNSNHHMMQHMGNHNTNSLNRPRYQSQSTAGGGGVNMRMNTQTLKINSRMNNHNNEYNSINHDSSLLMGAGGNNYQQNGNAFPSAPPSQTVLPPPPPSLNAVGAMTNGVNLMALQNANSNSHQNYGDFSKYMASHHHQANTNPNSINVPIVLYPNYSSRTLLGGGQQNYSARKFDSNGASGAYGTLSRNY